MKAYEGMGLVCAGGLSQSFLTRMPVLLEHLGPIKGFSFRVSRQIANKLRAGYAASHYSALESSPMIWVSVPESSLDRILRDLVAQTPLRRAPYTNTMVVLCNCTRDTLTPSPLQATGVRVATLNLIPDSQDRIFVAEGHPETIRALRALLGRDKRKLIRLEPATKPLFFGGVHLGAALLLPWIAAGIECLRAAGFTRAEAVLVGELLGVRALRKVGKAGAKAWNRQTAAALRRVMDQDLPAIRSHNPRLAQIYEEGIRVALASFL